MRHVATALTAALALACSDGGRSAQDNSGDSAVVRQNVPSARVDTAPAPAAQNTSPAPSSPAVTTPMLTAVRSAARSGGDRIVFEFNAPLPGYKLEYIDRPVRQCGSGEVVALPGDAWLSIRFFPANAHTEEGQPSVRERDQTFTGRNLKQLKLICDFEAVVEWVAAVGSPWRYKVMELNAPYRLVIDVEKGE